MNKAALGVLLLSLIGVSTFSFGQSGASKPLKLEATIPMLGVQGHIDHLLIDLKVSACSWRPWGTTRLRSLT
jgi:hypothetical protein